MRDGVHPWLICSHSLMEEENRVKEIRKKVATTREKGQKATTTLASIKKPNPTRIIKRFCLSSPIARASLCITDSPALSVIRKCDHQTSLASPCLLSPTKVSLPGDSSLFLSPTNRPRTKPLSNHDPNASLSLSHTMKALTGNTVSPSPEFFTDQIDNEKKEALTEPIPITTPSVIKETKRETRTQRLYSAGTLSSTLKKQQKRAPDTTKTKVESPLTESVETVTQSHFSTPFRQPRSSASSLISAERRYHHGKRTDPKVSFIDPEKTLPLSPAPNLFSHFLGSTL